MKRLGIIVLVVLFALLTFWVGLMLNFPGETMSRYVERQVNGRQGFDVALTPAELRWSGLYVAKAELRRRDNPAAEPLFTITEFSVPITWRLVQGLTARGTLGRKGEVRAYLPWSAGGEALLDAQAELGEIPLPGVVRPLTVAGTLELHGRFLMDPPAQQGQRLPTGTLEGIGRGLAVSGAKFGATELPEARLETFNAVLETGRTITVRRFEYRGDLQGTVEGSVTPNLRDPRNSTLALKITTAFRDLWLARLGDLRPILEGFLNRGRLELTLSGTVGRPQLIPVRGSP